MNIYNSFSQGYLLSLLGLYSRHREVGRELESQKDTKIYTKSQQSGQHSSCIGSAKGVVWRNLGLQKPSPEPDMVHSPLVSHALPLGELALLSYCGGEHAKAPARIQAKIYLAMKSLLSTLQCNSSIYHV